MTKESSCVGVVSGAMSRPLHVEHEAGGLTILTLNRPEVRNAVDRRVVSELKFQLDAFDADDSRRVAILTGAGGNFSAGMDLKAYAAGQPPVRPSDRDYPSLMSPPRKPIIAAVNGYAVAGGLEMALCCDLIVAGRDAKFGLPEIDRGLVAAGGGLMRLARRIPHHVAMRLALTGEQATADEAAGWGLVSEVADGDALTAARHLAYRLMQHPDRALAATKQIVSASPDWPWAEAFERQRVLVDAVLASPDSLEGARAFIEHRAPGWVTKRSDQVC